MEIQIVIRDENGEWIFSSENLTVDGAIASLGQFEQREAKKKQEKELQDANPDF